MNKFTTSSINNIIDKLIPIILIILLDTNSVITIMYYI